MNVDANQEQRQHEEDLQLLKGLRLLDDEFMSMVFDKNIEGVQLILNIILERSDLIVTDVRTQSETKNINGHSTRFDIHAKDSTGVELDVEIQRADRGASSKRARFNDCMLGSTMLARGQDYSELNDSYVIFITENDVLGAGLPLYHINRWVEETKIPFGDGTHIIYSNGAYQNEENEIGQLMHDFRCTEPEDMHFSILADRVRYFKRTEGGQETMCKAMENMRKDAAAKAAHDRSVEIAEFLLENGMSCENVAKATKLTFEEVESLAAGKSA